MNIFEIVIQLLEKFIENYDSIKHVEDDISLFKTLGVKQGEFTYSTNPRENLSCGLCRIIFATAKIKYINSCDMSKIGECEKLKETLDELEGLKNKFFVSWKYFSGSTIYPVDGRKEYYSIKKVTDNPKRLDLAEHLLKEFKKVMV